MLFRPAIEASDTQTPARLPHLCDRGSLAAQKLARKASATVEAQLGHATDIVVICEQSPHWKAEEKGQKLLDREDRAGPSHSPHEGFPIRGTVNQWTFALSTRGITSGPRHRSQRRLGSVYESATIPSCCRCVEEKSASDGFARRTVGPS